jgi:hypothetical protein
MIIFHFKIGIHISWKNSEYLIITPTNEEVLYMPAAEYLKEAAKVVRIDCGLL